MMYHETPASNWPSVRKYGLRPTEGWVYLAEDPESAKFFASDVRSGAGFHKKRPKRWALLAVDLSDVAFDGIERDSDSGERNYRAGIGVTIPPDHVQLVEYFDASGY